MKFIIIAVCLFGAVFALEGEWNAFNIDDSTVPKLVAQGVEHQNTNSDGLYYKKLMKIVEADYRIVNDLTYDVKFLIGETNCTKSDFDATSCHVSANAIPELCTYEFLFRPWLGLEQITKAICAPTK